MSDASIESEEQYLIPLHFDVTAHHLPLDEFITSACSAKAIIDCFNEQIFERKVKYQLYVVPPKEGTFLELIGVQVLAVGSLAWLVLESDMGKSFIKNFTGKEPADWTGIAGAKLRELLLKTSNTQESLPPEVIRVQRDEFARLFVQIVLHFLEKEPDELRKIGLMKSRFREAYKAKNEFYEKCAANPDLKAIGFDTTPNFPIRRIDFPKHVTDIPPATDDDEYIDWEVSVENIRVHSPDWERDGRNWQARFGEDKDASFTIDDDDFWHHVKLKDMTPNFIDLMTVQWARDKNASGRKTRRVLKVINFNGMDLAAPLDDEKLKEKLKQFTVLEREQSDLFDPNKKPK